MQKLLILLVLVCAACGSSLPEPENGGVTLREATCKAAMLFYLLQDHDALVEKVANGELTLVEAMGFLGASGPDIDSAIQQYKACETLHAEPPAPANKVM